MRSQSLKQIEEVLRRCHAFAVEAEDVARHALPGKSNHSLAAEARRMQKLVERWVPDLKVQTYERPGYHGRGVSY